MSINLGENSIKLTKFVQIHGRSNKSVFVKKAGKHSRVLTASEPSAIVYCKVFFSGVALAPSTLQTLS